MTDYYNNDPLKRIKEMQGTIRKLTVPNYPLRKALARQEEIKRKVATLNKVKTSPISPYLTKMREFQKSIEVLNSTNISNITSIQQRAYEALRPYETLRNMVNTRTFDTGLKVAEMPEQYYIADEQYEGEEVIAETEETIADSVKEFKEKHGELPDISSEVQKMNEKQQQEFIEVMQEVSKGKQGDNQNIHLWLASIGAMYPMVKDGLIAFSEWVNALL